MTIDKFETILNKRLDLIREVLASKRKEYNADDDCLGNFKRAAKLDGKSEAEVLRGYMLKHWVSIMDIIEGRISGKVTNEKIGDAINFLILLEAVLQETK